MIDDIKDKGFSDKFSMEWEAITTQLKNSSVNLSNIIIVEEKYESRSNKRDS